MRRNALKIITAVVCGIAGGVGGTTAYQAWDGDDDQCEVITPRDNTNNDTDPDD